MQLSITSSHATGVSQTPSDPVSLSRCLVSTGLAFGVQI